MYKLISILIVFQVMLCTIASSASKADEAIAIAGINFGNIDINPGGDTISIDAGNGTAFPQSSRSIITGGQSGAIAIQASDPIDIRVTYPDTVELENGIEHTLTVSQIGPLSQYNGSIMEHPGGNVTKTIHIGGNLIIPASNTGGTYTGTLTIGLDFEYISQTDLLQVDQLHVDQLQVDQSQADQ